MSLSMQQPLSLFQFYSIPWFLFLSKSLYFEAFVLCVNLGTTDQAPQLFCVVFHWNWIQALPGEKEHLGTTSAILAGFRSSWWSRGTAYPVTLLHRVMGVWSMKLKEAGGRGDVTWRCYIVWRFSVSIVRLWCDKSQNIYPIFFFRTLGVWESHRAILLTPKGVA